MSKTATIGTFEAKSSITHDPTRASQVSEKSKTINSSDCLRITLFVIGFLAIIAGGITHAYEISESVYMPLYIIGGGLCIFSLVSQCRKPEKFHSRISSEQTKPLAERDLTTSANLDEHSQIQTQRKSSGHDTNAQEAAKFYLLIAAHKDAVSDTISETIFHDKVVYQLAPWVYREPVDAKGNTLLHLAVSFGNTKAVNELLKKNNTVKNDKNLDGMTPYDLANKRGQSYSPTEELYSNFELIKDTLKP